MVVSSTVCSLRSRRQAACTTVTLERRQSAFQGLVFGEALRPYRRTEESGDFDGDGNPDLAILQAATAGVTPVPTDAVLLYMGDGTGQFSGPHQFKVGGGPEGLVVAPLTNTGALDIAVSDAGSDSMSVLVNQGANTVTLSSSSNPSAVFGQVVLTATVQPKFSGSGTLSGLITFTDGGTTLGTASLNSSGSASLAATFTTTGDHALEAVFGGNASFVGGSSATLNQVVKRTLCHILTESSSWEGNCIATSCERFSSVFICPNRFRNPSQAVTS
jgi:hypothetical protein